MAKKLYVDIDKAVGMGYLSDWYQSSIDDTKPPIWTDEHIYELVNDFLIIPNDTPTADVEEVKRGEWKHLGGDEWCCTNCGEVVTTEGSWEKPTKKYCSNCGAKMDGGKANDT
jgi:hypothetical protein